MALFLGRCKGCKAAVRLDLSPAKRVRSLGYGRRETLFDYVLPNGDKFYGERYAYFYAKCL